VSRGATGRILARALPAAAIALAALTVSTAAVHALGGSHDAHRLLRGSVLLLNASLWWAFALVTVFRTVPAKRGPWVRGAALVALASVAAMAVDPGDAAHATWVQTAASGLVSLASLALVFGSLGRLGRCFGVLPDARGVVTRGPYRVVRHPIYLGEIGTFAGVLVASPNPRNVLALAALVLAQIGRARLEERTLAAAFPAYAEYAARTPMLIPRLRLTAVLSARRPEGGSALDQRAGGLRGL
jgi:protein-S-isoprenylcysteine O-methyltransferase Ste14